MQWALSDVATATGGVVAGDDATVTSVGIDSRRLEAGALFVALRAERDGHDFVEAAARAGAVAVMVDAAWPGGCSLPGVAVEDTGLALLDLGRAARARLRGEVVGITGSVGKTSTKDMAAAALSAERLVAANDRSFNNELGVPLTLANAPEAAEATIVEMGARGVGHISLLCDVAKPTIGVVTAVAAAHTELFGDLDGVALAKGELVAALDPSGTAVLNADDPRVAAMARLTTGDVLSYSAAGTPQADVVAEDLTVDGDLRPSFVVRSPWGSAEVRLEARGAHQVGNALAALTVAGRCGVDLDAAVAALAAARLSPWRMELARAPSGAMVLNDAYNANPVSMAAALRALSELPAVRRVAVLGTMAELGERSAAEHATVAALAASLGVDVIAVGTAEYGIEPVGVLDEALQRLGPLGPHDAVLVKGSRVAGLERLACMLVGG